MKKMTAMIFFLAAVSVPASVHPQDGPIFEAGSYARYLPARKEKDAPGKVGITEAGVEYSYYLKAFGKLPVELSLNSLYIGINNSTDVKLPAHLTGLGIDIETTLPFFDLDKTYLRLGISPSFYGDNWDFEGQDFVIPLRAYAIRRINDKLTLVGGIAVYPGFEQTVFPVLGFIYKASDRLIFNILPKRPNITYFLNGRTELFIEGGAYLGQEFNVSTAQAKNTALEYKEISVGGGVGYKFNKRVSGRVSAGGVFDRSLKYRDNPGEVHVKDGFYTELRIEIKL